jgi:hypothetical protein
VLPHALLRPAGWFIVRIHCGIKFLSAAQAAAFVATHAALYAAHGDYAQLAAESDTVTAAHGVNPYNLSFLARVFSAAVAAAAGATWAMASSSRAACVQRMCDAAARLGDAALRDYIEAMPENTVAYMWRLLKCRVAQAEESTVELTLDDALEEMHKLQLAAVAAAGEYETCCSRWAVLLLLKVLLPILDTRVACPFFIA